MRAGDRVAPLPEPVHGFGVRKAVAVGRGHVDAARVDVHLETVAAAHGGVIHDLEHVPTLVGAQLVRPFGERFVPPNERGAARGLEHTQAWGGRCCLVSRRRRYGAGELPWAAPFADSAHAVGVRAGCLHLIVGEGRVGERARPTKEDEPVALLVAALFGGAVRAVHDVTRDRAGGERHAVGRDGRRAPADAHKTACFPRSGRPSWVGRAPRA